jgi:hypothetical protein
VAQRKVFLAATVERFPYFVRAESDSKLCKGRIKRTELSKELERRYLPLGEYLT